MTEHGFRVFGDVLLQLLPAFLVVTYFLAIHADGNYPFKPFYLCLCFQDFTGPFINLLLKVGIQFLICPVQVYECIQQNISHRENDEKKGIFAYVDGGIKAHGYQGIIHHPD